MHYALSLFALFPLQTEEVVNALLDYGANPNVKNDFDKTALEVAQAQKSQVEAKESGEEIYARVEARLQESSEWSEAERLEKRKERLSLSLESAAFEAQQKNLEEAMESVDNELQKIE